MNMLKAHQSKRRLRKSQGRRAFTLIELVAVIAIIILLALILLPAILGMGGGKSISMARNSVDSYFNGIRLEAINKNSTVLVVVFPSDRGDPDREWTINYKSFTSGNSTLPKKVTAGFYAFYVDAFAKHDSIAADRLVYMDRDLVLINEFNDDVALDGSILQRPFPDTLLEKNNVSPNDLTAVIPDHKQAYLIMIRPDGKAFIPGDMPGYKMEQAPANQADADMVFVDESKVLLMDVSPHLKVRSRLLKGTEAESSKYKPLEQ